MNRLAAALYDRVMANLEAAGLSQWRRELLSPLQGRVLEIGAGTGRNLEMYPATVTELVLAEPDRHMRARLEARVRGAKPGVEITDAPAEALPFADGYFDAAVSTLVLCSVKDPNRVAGELRRVIRPGGRLVIIEHVAAEPGSRRARWQAGIEPVWKRVAGNCHLTRDTATTLSEAGFDAAALKAESMPEAPAVVRPTVRGYLALAR
jgi:ubiquinone/menaquinone biosynthesis C-methylase UbiE